jgi:hypothetical protein
VNDKTMRSVTFKQRGRFVVVGVGGIEDADHHVGVKNDHSGQSARKLAR